MQRRSRLAGLTAAAGLLLASTVPVPAQIVPPDQIPTTRTGTGAIKGRVVDAASGAGISRARVRLLMAGAARPSVLTGADGEFAFANLPEGPVMLSVERVTYLPAQLPDAIRTFRSMRRQMILKQGQTIENVVVRLYPGSVISGRILDAHGDPVEYVSVAAMRLVPGGKPEMRASIQTNDLGEYRIPRLQPGTYVVTAVPRRTGPDILERLASSAVRVVVAESSTTAVALQRIELAHLLS